MRIFFSYYAHGLKLTLTRNDLNVVRTGHHNIGVLTLSTGKQTDRPFIDRLEGIMMLIRPEATGGHLLQVESCDWQGDTNTTVGQIMCRWINKVNNEWKTKHKGISFYHWLSITSKHCFACVRYYYRCCVLNENKKTQSVLTPAKQLWQRSAACDGWVETLIDSQLRVLPPKDQVKYVTRWHLALCSPPGGASQTF